MKGKRISSVLRLFGIDMAGAAKAARALPRFLAHLHRFRHLHGNAGNKFAWGRLYPCLGDVGNSVGQASGHYFYQDLLIAQRVFARSPRRHVDIGSRVDGFVAHVATFREIEVIDIRPLQCAVPNIRFRQLDIIADFDPVLSGAYDSASCLHALEHFGLGRYGDPLDYMGFAKGFAAISRLLCKGGVLYLSVPMGPQRVEFNAHRVFSLPYVRDLYKDEYTLNRFCYVDDSGALHEEAAITGCEADENYGCWFGLAILELEKRDFTGGH